MKKKKKTKSTIPRRHRMEEPVWRSEAPKKTSSKLYYFDKRYYFNLKSHRWKRHIDGTWDNGPIISRVPLEPEQAVLSCCSADYGGFNFIRMNAPDNGCQRGNLEGMLRCGVLWGKDPNCRGLGAAGDVTPFKGMS